MNTLTTEVLMPELNAADCRTIIEYNEALNMRAWPDRFTLFPKK
jgi:hypothetical protein